MILRHYGAAQYDPALFIPIKNDLWVKPRGGLWTSPLSSRHSWYRFCLENNFRLDELTIWFDLRLVGRWVTINGQHDLQQLPWLFRGMMSSGPDFEEILRQGYDAIHLTELGEWRTRDPLLRRHLLGWDCESVLILNPEALQPYNHEPAPIPVLRPAATRTHGKEIPQPQTGGTAHALPAGAGRDAPSDPRPLPSAAFRPGG